MAFMYLLPGLTEIIPDEERVMTKDRGQVLYISPSQVTDTAVYKCVAISSAGEEYKDFDLRIYGLHLLSSQS